MQETSATLNDENVSPQPISAPHAIENADSTSSLAIAQPQAAAFVTERESPFPEFNVYQIDTEFVYVEDEEARNPRTVIDVDTISVPRWILYVQGALLGAMALVGFMLGYIVSEATSMVSDAPHTAGPVRVTGEVAYDAGDHLPTPDVGATVMLVPEGARPEQKVGVASLRPGSERVDATDPAIAAIREIGGDFVRADRDGKFRLVVPTPGDYFLLIVSAQRVRSGNERPAPQDLAELGRYVESAPELLANDAYRWVKRRLLEDSTENYVFP
jgi:hypothetical protein